MSCQACGSLIQIEHNDPSANPPRVLGTFPDDDSVRLSVKHLPDDVAGCLEGAVRVLRADVPDAAAVQLRRTLEAAAAHFNVDKKKTLVQNIRQLIEEGHVTKSFGDVLQYVRIIGNQGAHHTDEHVSAETVAAALNLNFTIQLLRNLFEVPAELQALRGGDELPEPGEITA